MSIKAKKSLGQNFLKDLSIIDQIINHANIEDRDVVEVGPGQGALTTKLASKAKSLTAYEIDKDMINILNVKINNPNFVLIHKDFLLCSLEEVKENSVLVANIPYYITSDILFKVFINRNKFSKAIIMMQKEVADRIIAKANTSNYSKLSVTSQYFANVKKLFDVSPQCFEPAPKVFSSVVLFEFNKKQEMDDKDFLEFVKLCFAQRRKTLINNLLNKYNKEQIWLIFEKMNFKSNVRAQELSLNQFIKLYQEIKNEFFN
ncbi:16S rRNA (adenine(1518)-N(6)/adenine(1519)-N(6))-dimethyltransferase RsmA [Mycoplasma phocoenae]|uniref:Ribosomal RNA small subunit methyltransferase A n=1 Tax=Mycoplasma phocoenae TaxID=754517 RepID=A0A858U2L8_9MOLU|nr:16S rRNA (adenine(1518)-N(6)/adenine(1519)-N(6))-dimethyltransferase RsmA [Mycoplasma phocoenae]QJG66720.1 16S rRNA (adenine(1518)-N(6)/adenine(1519)-N(6))-dimethyltransferase RsmA [Mycoplasma phocoenae]